MSKTKPDTTSQKQETTGAATNGGAGAENGADASTQSDTSSQKQESTGVATNGGAGAENGADASIQSDTSSPQPQTTGAATNGGAGAETKPKAAAKAKASYLVGACPVLHDHEVYLPGNLLALTEAEAARLGSKVIAAQA